jgi:enoyl-CoA hydratase/carnithine racemase
VEAELIALRKECFASDDLQEGVKAFGQKRPARWQGR